MRPFLHRETQRESAAAVRPTRGEPAFHGGRVARNVCVWHRKLGPAVTMERRCVSGSSQIRPDAPRGALRA